MSRPQNYINKNRIKNVTLHPNASFEEMLKVMKSSKYFLHLLINEPFGITAVQAIAAGCLPLVHNSGGQRETVPLLDLRYSSFEEIPVLIDNLEKKKQMEIDKIVKHLQKESIEHFDQSVFIEKMTNILKQALAV